MAAPAAKRPRAGELAATPEPSRRVLATDKPCIVTMQEMMRGKLGLLSLAQGVVHWQPPPTALGALGADGATDGLSSYGDDDGLAELRAALAAKLRAENSLEGVEVMVTIGANQAYVNVVLSLVDAGDAVVLFEPFYFNHMMALQMTGSADAVVPGKTTPELLPDVEWLADRLAATDLPAIRMVTVVNPGNPTGVTIPEGTLKRISELCAEHKVWLVVDNTYEYFTYEAEGASPHSCVGGDHVVNVFSFSKAFGMMGWRVGYLAFPPALKASLLKVQDTIPICPCILSQRVALGALQAGREWVKARVAGLSEQKRLVCSAVRDTLGDGSLLGGSGAIYLMVRLPAAYQDDVAVVRWLAEEHRVCVIPGSACGARGFLRLSYANNQVDRCEEAAKRLRAGLREL
eukprot:CAMPEP_0179106638 /NCGR_PEP_ID=MMETSP0796-20121207/49596_1 /TAXON_ID=73915 /ORGANISM="Pyrodinium bahamense, Strain pbaha01" /LENGTH=402 /DNA_ID=CAMNT_0020804681 /DNA_START=9 /DNA_END=1214 /DNA_ORIENTATION=+